MLICEITHSKKSTKYIEDKIEKAPRDFQGEKSRKDTASSWKLTRKEVQKKRRDRCLEGEG